MFSVPQLVMVVLCAILSCGGWGDGAYKRTLAVNWKK